MNYIIRGAVNAISVPYQYYKDLPPINPSTLTGAIDVIVLKRPTADGDSELVCSPFHVRFGKWHVLRLGDKKVNVSVNGHPIPFCMKLGEAGEAFFVFETDSDVPEELITSPILQPTQPDKLQEPPPHDLAANVQPPASPPRTPSVHLHIPPATPSSMLSLNGNNLPVQEYSWEWGAFPQPSPMDTAFGKSRRSEGFISTFEDEHDAAQEFARSGEVKDNQYITREDQSHLADGLAVWSDTATKGNVNALSSRPSSPSPDEDDTRKGKEAADEAPSSNESQDHQKSKLGLPKERTISRTSSSWWTRGKAKEVDINANRPSLKGSALDHIEDIRDGGRTHTAPASLLSTKTAPSPVEQPGTPSGQQFAAPQRDQSKKFAKTLRLSSDQLKALNLKPGANTITFSLSTSDVIACTARIFVWDSTDLVVVSDIDGTITKSDGLGHVFAMIGRDWTHVGVAKLYTDISRNGYKMMYLTSRAIGQADATRDYLKGIKQNDYQLPEGPVIMSPDRLIASLHREVIMRKPEVFKMACLRDIQRLFGEASRNPFYAGFGNRITDALSYRSVDVPRARIFTIDSSGEVKMELLELAGYKSSYIHMTDLVDQMFPPIHQKWAAEFTDFNYWKGPMLEFPLPDLMPPSPALSARSDTSNQSTLSRLRNFSLAGSRQSNTRPSILPQSGQESVYFSERSTELKQMSSFERLSSRLASLAKSTSGESRRSTSRESRTSSSLTYADSGSDDEYLYDDDLEKGGSRSRRRSMTSMPGSLDDLHFEVDDNVTGEEYSDIEGGGPDEEGEVDGYDAEVGDEEGGVEEEAFDEDFLATTQMKKVPFL